MSLLVVGASTSAAPAGSTLPPAETIKLAQESMAKWQKLVQDQMSECQKLLAVSNLLLEYFISHRSSSWLLSLDFCSGHGGTRELQASRELGSSRLERAGVKARSGRRSSRGNVTSQLAMHKDCYKKQRGYLLGFCQVVK